MNRTQLLYFLFRKRLLELERVHLTPEQTQREELSLLINQAKNTEWGKRHHFSSINTYEEFANSTPLQSYDEVKPYIERMLNGEHHLIWPSKVNWFAKSSGTTNDKSKFIPVSNESLGSCHYKGAKDCIAFYLSQHPESNLFKGKSLILGGSHKISSIINDTFVGDLSAILIHNNPFYTNWIRTPEKSVALMDEWEAKLEMIINSTIHQDIRSLSGVPSWMMVLIKRILERKGCETLTDIWPNLEVFFHGGVSFKPYKEQYETLIPSKKMSYLENYNASEGYFAIQSQQQDASMLMMLDYGVFFEFIPLSEYEDETPIVLPIWEVELGKNYAVIITTNSGLWRYKLGDTVCFTSKNPYKITISGRTKHHINVFGEELMIDNAEKGLIEACMQTGATIKEYTVAPEFMSSREKGRHQWLIEFERQPASISDFAHLLDSALQNINSDYEAKRYKDITLNNLEIVVAKQNLFENWLKSKGKLGGQHKVPRLSNERTYIEELLASNS